jgi:hypothetical protein
MKFKRIYINGSSLSCGGSLEPNTQAYNHYINTGISKWDNEKEVSYGNVLAKDLGIECVNDAKQGGGLDRIIRKTFDYIDTLTQEEIDTTLFLFDIPLQPSRVEIYSKEFKDFFVMSVYDRKWNNNIEGKSINSKISFSRAYKKEKLNLSYDQYIKHDSILNTYVDEYYDYEIETKRLLRQLILFYNFLDNKKISYIIDLNDSLFTASGYENNDVFKIYNNNYSHKTNPNIIQMKSLWQISVYYQWRICDEIKGNNDSHLGYYGNKKYAEFIKSAIL